MRIAGKACASNSTRRNVNDEDRMMNVSLSSQASLTSWIAEANTPDCHFPIQNLPFGIFSTPSHAAPRVGVAIGNQVLDLAALNAAGLLGNIDGSDCNVFASATLNAFIALGKPAWRATRQRLQALLSDQDPTLRDHPSLREQALVPMTQARLHLPIDIPGYTDFYSSKEHATNVGRLFRDPDNALLPNWLEIPIGYNGRASSVVVSGTNVKRPVGQLKLPDSARPILAPSRKLDFELEMAFVVGKDSTLGTPIPVGEAEDYIFGLVVMNDWSARDIQQWEYVPLGPFNSKTFATSISPWIVTLDALEPFRVAGPEQHPEPLDYLRHAGEHSFGIALDVALQAQGSEQPSTICRTNFRHMYWSMAQQLAHHTVSGCNVRIGDLMGSGTISGSAENSFGSLLELTRNGTKPVQLDGGVERRFLEDGDTVAMSARCEGDGYVIGFGEVRGTILPAALT
jgi:fumarylacetoacetase